MDAGDGIDYSDWFISDHVYDSIGEAVQAAKQIALTLNFHLIKGSNKSNDSEKECRVYLYCSRGPARKSEGSIRRNVLQSQRSVIVHSGLPSDQRW